MFPRPTLKGESVATKTVRSSDFTGKDIAEGKEARVVVSDHPSLSGGTVELDIDSDEVGKLESKKLSMVSLAVYVPGETVKRIIMDAAAFDGLFKGSAEEVLAQAPKAGQAAPTGARRRGRPRGTSAAPKAEKIDYTSLEHAGRPHRGRITEAEAAIVRDNLADINDRLTKEGVRGIDPKDADMKRKYGF